MNDTPKHILQKQFEIVMARPLSVRISEIFDLTELSRQIISNRIREKFPDISEIELKIELFKTFYRFDFDKETLEKIAVNMRDWLENQAKNSKT